MQIRVTNDAIEVDGYVNAVERKSKPIRSRMGQFVERIAKGAFSKALSRNDNVRLLLNHDRSRDLGGTREGNLKLKEDNIGLRVRATITDPEVVEKGRRGDLVGWSFGFEDVDVDVSTENGMPTREVRDMNLREVSILDKAKRPAYEGTLVCVRSEDEVEYYSEPFCPELEIRDESGTNSQPQQAEPEANKKTEETVDYSKFEAAVAEMKGVLDK